MDFWDRHPVIKKELQKVEKLIEESVVSRNSLLSRVIAEQFSAGGKRIRPALVLIASKFGKNKGKRVLSMAGAVEILHTATLIHDDVIDCAGLRRGRETLCRQHGINMAVYAGDYLFTRAVLMLSGVLPAEKLELIAKAIKSICEGDVDQYRDRDSIDVSVLRYLKRVGRKTAVLFGAACSLGAYAGKCSPDVTRNLVVYGYSYGVAFQIRDDLMDFISTTATEGKPVGKDLIEGVVTLPAIYSIQNNPQLKNEFRAFFEGERNSENAGRLIELVRQSGGIERAARLLEKYIERGLAALERLPDNYYRSVLEELIRGLSLEEFR